MRGVEPQGVLVRAGEVSSQQRGAHVLCAALLLLRGSQSCCCSARGMDCPKCGLRLRMVPHHRAMDHSRSPRWSAEEWQVEQRSRGGLGSDTSLPARPPHHPQTRKAYCSQWNDHEWRVWEFRTRRPTSTTTTTTYNDQNVARNHHEAEAETEQAPPATESENAQAPLSTEPESEQAPPATVSETEQAPPATGPESEQAPPATLPDATVPESE